MADEVRQSQLEISKAASELLLEISRRRRRIDLHNNELKCFAANLERENPDLLRYDHHHVSKRRRRRMYNYSKFYRPSKILKRRSYQYKPIDGNIYKFLLWAREEEKNDNRGTDNNKALRFEVTINFMYKLRSGLFIRQKSRPWDIVPFTFESNCNTNKIPVGLSVVIINLGIPDTCREAIFKDISRFAAPYPVNCSNVILCMEIQIAIWQLAGEDVLETKFHADVDKLCREAYLDNTILENEANLQPLKLLDASFSCNTGIVVEEEGDCCSICLEKLGGCSSSLPCSHVYHYDCIFKWMSLHNYCPLCRHPYCRVFHPIQSK